MDKILMALREAFDEARRNGWLRSAGMSWKKLFIKDLVIEIAVLGKMAIVSMLRGEEEAQVAVKANEPAMWEKQIGRIICMEDQNG